MELLNSSLWPLPILFKCRCTAGSCVVTESIRWSGSCWPCGPSLGTLTSIHFVLVNLKLLIVEHLCRTFLHLSFTEFLFKLFDYNRLQIKILNLLNFCFPFAKGFILKFWKRTVSFSNLSHICDVRRLSSSTGVKMSQR